MSRSIFLLHGTSVGMRVEGENCLGCRDRPEHVQVSCHHHRLPSQGLPLMAMSTHQKRIQTHTHAHILSHSWFQEIKSLLNIVTPEANLSSMQ